MLICYGNEHIDVMDWLLGYHVGCYEIRNKHPCIDANCYDNEPLDMMTWPIV